MTNLPTELKTTHFFQTAFELCPFCGNSLMVAYISNLKVIITLRGEIQVRQSIMECRNPECPHGGDGTFPKFQSEEFLLLALPHCNVGLDVTLYIGFQMHVKRCSQNEVWAELKKLGVQIDLSTVFRHYQKYLIFVKGLAENEIAQLRIQFQQQGGFILSLDAVHSKGSPPLLVCQELTTGRTLFTQLLHTENAPEISAALEEIQTRFGRPVAVISDMNSANITAVAQVFPEIPHQYCQFHFLKNVGKALLKEEYELLTENKKEFKKKLRAK